MALKTKVLLATSMLGGLAAFAPAAALAQTAPAAQEPTSVEEVVVTGSRIRRDPTNAPTPLIQVSRDAFISTGQPNIVDVLSDIPALEGSTVPEDTTGSNLNDGGLSLLNLRDLGANRTLTLVDGKRHVGASVGTLSVDIDTIPRLLIQNVEIVTGANSAQYGADAVSGVVNFILRKDYEGVEFDGNMAQESTQGPETKRIAALVGHNFFDGKLNVYGSYEYEHDPELRDSKIPFRRRAYTLLTVDFDPATANNDGVFDQVLIQDARSISRTFGGTLTLAGDIQPDSTRNIPLLSCTSGTTGAISSNCITPDPGVSYVFDQTGAPRLANFGTFRSTIGRTRNIVVNGDGVNLGTEQGQFSRLPDSKNHRWQGGINFNVTDDLQLYAEAKYAKETTFDEGQPTFFDVGIVNIAANTDSLIFGTSSMNIGLDNAYLDPTLRARIQSNTRPTYRALTAAEVAAGQTLGVQTGTVADPRARLSTWGPTRTQLNERSVERYVVGARGNIPDLAGLFHNTSYEISYVTGKLKNQNFERGADVGRFHNSIDAVVDTAGVVHGKPGEIVCRVQLLAAKGVTVQDQGRTLAGGSTVNYAANSPDVTGCVASRVFGTNGFSADALKYINAEINVKEQNKQQDGLGYVSTELFDFWGAGRIGLVLGAEWRREAAQGLGRSTSTAGRLLFLNTGPDFPSVSYETKEAFTEVNIPLLSNVFLAKKLEIGGAYRRSDYTTVGQVDTYNMNGVWRISSDIMFRANAGKSVRVPNLSETFRAPTQTFANGFVDPCSDLNLTAVADAKIKANRIKNCQALGIPTGTNITYPSSPAGFNAGNPFLKPERSFSHSVSAVITPRFWPNATFVFDYYNINIKDVIAAVTVQTAANQCVSGDTLNVSICQTITRAGAAGGPGTTTPYAVSSFIQGSVNYARTMNRGVDFQFLYHTDVEKLTGLDWGRLNYHLSGTYLIHQHDFTNIQAPDERSNFETTVGLPRVRFSSRVDWLLNEKLTLSWNLDWQSAQEIVDPDNLGGNLDIYDKKYFTTGNFAQHDFTFAYHPKEKLTLRGGVTNAFNKWPALWLGSQTSADNFDLFGRRFFVGFNYKM